MCSALPCKGAGSVRAALSTLTERRVAAATADTGDLCSEAADSEAATACVAVHPILMLLLHCLLMPTLLSVCLLPCSLLCPPSSSAGTVQTMGKLLKTPEKRMAAVITLCALVQRCK